jgi:asparagine synthase (glutamine-hydrolysing)
MCGIAGILDLATPISPETLDRFTDSLAHRGPDGRGTWIGPGIGLGHRRLSILDPTDAGACPMEHVAPDGRRFRITFNGEVYNFLELRAELEGEGWRFRSDTDTEVVVASFARWGRGCQERFNGMWAFAIWDESARSLFMSRDRFGVKPLYYSAAGTRIAFASEIKAFASLDGFRRELDLEVAAVSVERSQALEGGSDRTLMKGLNKLMPGHWLEVDREGRVTGGRWWNTMDHLVEVPSSRDERVARFRELFLDAVALRMRSDVAVGTCLSGGIDSTAVASAMGWLHGEGRGELRRAPREWRRSFVASFPGSFIDETEHATDAARHAGCEPSYWVFDPKRALDDLLDSVWSMEEVYPGVAVPIWSLYREMRRAGVFVSLDGHGGDELLGGYTWYLDWPMDKVNANLESDFHRTLLPSILRNYDRCSMAHGIEVRMPFMDWRLVCLAFSLPPEDKIGGGFTKRVVRDALAGIMPDSIRRRRSKFGFNSPMIEWYNGGMIPLLSEVMSHPYWLESPWWNGAEVRRDVLGRCAAKSWTMSDWNLSLETWSKLNIVLWTRMFVDGEVLRGGGVP